MPTLPEPSRSRLAPLGLGLSLALAAPPAAEAQQRPARVLESSPAKPSANATAAAPRASEGLVFANRLYADRRYDLAADEYERFLAANPAGPEAADAAFSLGNARLFLGKYAEARRAFENFLRIAPDHPNAPTARFRVGEAAYVTGDLPAARAALEAYLSGRGELRYRDAAWSHLGDVATRQEDLPRARQAYESVLAGKPPANLAARARYGLGRTLAGQGEADAAIAALTPLAEGGGPEWSPKAWFQIGQVQATAGRWDEAVSAYAKGEAAAPGTPLAAEARLERAGALVRLDRRDQAEALLRTLVDDASPAVAAAAADALGESQLAGGNAADALATLDRALAQHATAPAAPMLRYHAAEAALKLGRADDARARFLALAEGGAAVPWADEASIRAATLALDARDPAEARRLAGPFAATFPNSPLRAEARLIDGRAALASGQPKEAIALLGSGFDGAKVAPAVSQAARYYLGLAYRADGRAAEAAAILDAVAQAPDNPVSTDATFMVGQGHVEAGRFAEGIAALEKYLAARPKGEVADYALARIAQAQIGLNQFDEAAATVERLAAAYPTSATIASTELRLGEAALAAGKFETAAAWLQKAAAHAPREKSARARSGRGWALLQAGQGAEAAAAFAALLEATPADPLAPEAALGRARALEAAGPAADALAAYGVVVDQYPKSPQAGPAALARARLLAKAGQFAEAAAEYARVDRDFAATAGEPADTIFAEWGWALIDAAKPTEADAVFERLLAEAPDAPRAADARFNLAESAFAAKKYDRVADLLAPVVAPGSAAKPDLVQSSLFRLARAEVERGEWARAGVALKRLVDEFPDGSFRREARFWQAEVAARSGDATTAEAGFAALAAEPPAPTDPKGLIATAARRRVQCLVELGRWADVLAAADAMPADAAAEDPQAGEVDYARGRAYQALAKFDEARAAFDRAIASRKGSELAARAQLMRGETFFHQGQHRDALREFLRVALMYDAPEWKGAALLEAGKVHEKLDEWSKAVETYETLQKHLKQFPDERLAAEAARRLAAARGRIARPEGEGDARVR